MSSSPAKMQATVRRTQVLIADDYPSIRRMVRSTLDQHSRFEVCSEAENGAEAVREARKFKPDVVVLNLSMPVWNGFEAARRIIATLPGTAIVILTSHADQRFIDEAKKIGVRGYVAKTEMGEALVIAIELALEGSDFVLVT
jgi:DNA-binding NarL/FixJ family response regulator